MRLEIGCGLVVLGVLFWHAGNVPFRGALRWLAHPQVMSWIVALFVGSGLFVGGTAFSPEHLSELHAGLIGTAVIGGLAVAGWFGVDRLALHLRSAGTTVIASSPAASAGHSESIPADGR